MLFIRNSLNKPFHPVAQTFLGNGRTRLDVEVAVSDFCEFQGFHNFVSVKGGLEILLVGEDQDGDVGKEFFLHERLKFLGTLSESHVISGVNDVHHTVSVLVVVLPVGTDLTLTTDIPDVQFKSVLSLYTSDHQRGGMKIINTKAKIKLNSCTYERLDVESLGGHDVGSIFVTHGL